MLDPGRSLEYVVKTQALQERSSMLEADPCLCRNVPCSKPLLYQEA